MITANKEVEGVRPVILKKRCPAQANICRVIVACPNKAISYVEDDNEPLGGRIEIDYAKCSGCGTCAKECCGMAIKME